jgi:catechol 2,3-dioxygenase-like lactoylglutathione lyase family enzyme
MRILFAIIVIIVELTVSAVSAAPAGSAVRRSTLLVADLDRSIAFYEALGFARWYDQGGPRDPNRPMALPLNVKPAASRLVIMKGRDPWIGMIGLLAYDKPKPPSNRTLADKIGAGDTILMVEIADVRAAHAQLVSLGVRILQPPQEFETKLADGSPIKGVNFFAVDPDGRVIEASQPNSGAPEGAK